MRDCVNAEMRDLLPDLLHGRLAPEQRGVVDAHVAACAECRAELELLQRIRGSVPTPPLHTAAIVGALPAYRSPRFRTAPVLRIAAGLILFAGLGGVLLRSARREPALTDSVAQVPAATATVLSLGETFQDLSDSDLEALADELQVLDGIISEEPEEVVVPVTGDSGS